MIKKKSLILTLVLGIVGASANAQNFSCYSAKDPNHVFLTGKLRTDFLAIDHLTMYYGEYVLLMKKNSQTQKMDFKKTYTFVKPIKLESTSGFWEGLFSEPAPGEWDLKGPWLYYHMAHSNEFSLPNLTHDIDNVFITLNKKEFTGSAQFRATFNLGRGVIKLRCQK